MIWSAPSSPLLYLLYCVWLSHASGIRSGDWLHLNVYTSTQFKCQLKDIVTAIIPSLNQTHCSFSSLVFLLIDVTAKSQVLDGFRGWSSCIRRAERNGTDPPSLKTIFNYLNYFDRSIKSNFLIIRPSVIRPSDCKCSVVREQRGR